METETLKKLKEKQIQLNNASNAEACECVPIELIHSLNNEVLNHILCGIKYSKSKDIPARVLNNWINEGVIAIDEADKGKVKRFNKIQSIWLTFVEEARKYGMPLEDLRFTYQEIMVSEIPNFSILKLAVINTILLEPQVIRMLRETNHDCEILSEKEFSKKKSPIPPDFLSCLIFSLSQLIRKEFPKAKLNLSLDIEGFPKNEEKMVLLFLLKTASYSHMNIYMSENDVRLVKNTDSIINNKELSHAISKWKFHKIEVTLEDGKRTIINNNF